MAPELHLYRVNGYCSMMPHALLHHLNITFTTTRMTYGPNGNEAADGSLSHQEYLKINPMGLVPALSVDGTVITEMPAVLSSIASQAPEQNLRGRTPVEQAQVIQWMAYLSGTLHSGGFGAYLRPYRFVDTHEEMYEVVKAKGLKVISECFERIEGQIRGRIFMIGEGLTTVDFNVYAFYRWGKQFGLQMEKYSEYGRLVRMVEELDGFKKMLEVESLQSVFAIDTSKQ